MKISLAQIKPVKGDVGANIATHLQLIELSLPYKADLIIFPELSITGYEPTLAKDLAMHPDDARLDVFQAISNSHHLSIGIGVPVKTKAGITISLLFFQPNKKREIYSKQHLHPDEESWFISGQNTTGLIGEKSNAALAICYELFVPEHAEKAHQNGAEIYLASVAKSVQGIGKATERLSQIARAYSMMVGMANCSGLNDGMVCSGKSSVWNCKGELLGQLDDHREGILVVDTETEEVSVHYR